MTNEFYNHGSYPAAGASGSSAPMRAELDAITSGFALLPTMAANGGRALRVNAGATALEAGPTSLAGTAGKTLTVNLSVTLAGTDGKTLTVNDSTAFGTNTITMAGGEVVTFTASYALTLRTTAATDVTLPTSGTLSIVQGQNALTCYLLPSMEDGCRGYMRAGFDWWSRTPGGWGGPFGFQGLVDGATGIAYSGEAATGYIEQVSYNLLIIGDSAAHTYGATRFQIAETQTVANLYLKLSKVGNPTNNLQAYLYADSGSQSPGVLVTNGTATAVSGKVVTADTNNQWYRFNFATPPSLTGGTAYWIVLKSSGAVDASNYWSWAGTTTPKYPWARCAYGDAVPAWSGFAFSMIFLVELSATAQMLQSGGTFDGKLQGGGSGASGTLTMSRGLCSMANLRLGEQIMPQDFTLNFVGTALTKSVTVWDTGYGEDHDRFVLTINASGFPVLTVYDGLGGVGAAAGITTVTSAIDCSTGTHSIGVRINSTVAKLFVDGTTYTSGAVTINFDNNFAVGNVGTMWLLGGFPLAVTDTLKTNMSTLPSAGAVWTWTGTGTEANCMSVSGAGTLASPYVLSQNKNGYTALQTGYYDKATIGLSNANGWDIGTRLRTVSSVNTAYTNDVLFGADDGSKVFSMQVKEYFLSTTSTGAPDFYTQADYKSKDTVFKGSGKGTDYFLYANRRLVIDGSGKLTAATATNDVFFGDISGASGESADAQWKYARYYNTAWVPPQFTSGSISDFAIWQGDQTALWPLLYNGGSPVSVKALLGLAQNYLDKSAKLQKVIQRAITAAPSSVSTSLAVIPEMERFVIADCIDVDVNVVASNSNITNGTTVGIKVDGVAQISGIGDIVQNNEPVATYQCAFALNQLRNSYLGLHKVEGCLSVSANTDTIYSRNLKIGVAL